MDARKRAKKILKHVPPTSRLIKRQELLEKIVLDQEEELSSHLNTIRQLEKRNDMWAEEVRQLRHQAETMHIIWPVDKNDIITADFRNVAKIKLPKKKPPFTLNWVIPPMGPVSGGHADIFRTMAFLESRGHKCRIYFYDPRNEQSLESIKENLKHYPKLSAELYYNESDMAPCDAIFATNWFSAYPVFNYPHPAKKFYFVQDFEAYFEPVGTYSTLAENTYKFGFHGLTLGDWLADKLTKEYGMACDRFKMGVDKNEYYLTNKSQQRKKILFYARPVTPRRGFELGVLALEVFHKKHPEYEINFLGWDTSRYDIPFPYVNHGILSVKQLNELYNKCAAGLVLSYTNMSLLPLEMLASGCIPVMNDSYHTHLVDYADQVEYALSQPQAIADALSAVVTDKNLINRAQTSAKHAQKYQWKDTNEALERVLLRELT